MKDFDSIRKQNETLVAALQRIDETYDKVLRFPLPCDLISAILKARAVLAVHGLTNPQHVLK